MGGDCPPPGTAVRQVPLGPCDYLFFVTPHGSSRSRASPLQARALRLERLQAPYLGYRDKVNLAHHLGEAAYAHYKNLSLELR